MNSNYNFDHLRPANTLSSVKLQQDSPWVEKTDLDQLDNQNIRDEVEQVSTQEETKISLNDLLIDHHSKMTEILNHQLVTIEASQGDLQILYFDVEKPSVITIKAWPANDDSDPDIYLSNATPFVSTSNYQWKSANIGSDRIDVHPQDPKYKIGRYYLGANPYRVGINKFYVSLTLIDAKKVHELQDDQEHELNVLESEFFQYSIKHLGTSYLYIQCSERKNTELFISTLNIYPSEKEHKWAFGELPLSIAEKSKQNPFMRDIFTEATPFEIEENGITYYREFKDKTKYIPKSEEELIDPSQSNVQSSELKSVLIQKEDWKQDSGIKVLLESEAWRFVSNKAHFGLYNKSGQDQIYKFKLTEIKEEDILPVELKDKFIFFEELFNSKEEAAVVSQKERQRKNVCDKTEFTYGEVMFTYFIPLMGLTQPQEGESFWDLGCGGGRPLIISSLAFPQLKKCIGVELLDGLYDLAQQTASDYMKQATDRFPNERIVPLEIIKGDMLQIDWSDADIIYASSICFPDELVEGICDQARKLKKGARILTLKSFPDRDYLRMEYSLKIKMSWGRCQVAMYRKITDPELDS
ncbi:sam-dependent methyltransferase [Stylonychia lemnae]|uniref:Histone-lysine N-methyltransferase, H3 lysine-79 specific n=1 Tax=Stylonychia lemnae TaxID=5949 RepID=A0A078AUX2_STYLE|nr:sam-dependent methyltransferase [Stylonychia lemnae]|eukprot:CDW84668.1 sam-dependent methyltransferase [Stylonychia lemnae]